MFSVILVLVNVYLLYLLVLEKHNEENGVYLLRRPNALMLENKSTNNNECHCEETLVSGLHHTPTTNYASTQLQLYQHRPNYSVRIVALMGFGLCFQIIYSIVAHIKYSHEKYKNKNTFLDHYMRRKNV